MPSDRLLRVNQVAEILNISHKTIYNRCNKKSENPLPFKVIRIGKSVRFSENEILKYCKEGDLNGNSD